MFHSLFIPAVYVSQLPCFTAVYLAGRVFQLFIPAVHAQAGNVIQLFTSPHLFVLQQLLLPAAVVSQLFL